MRKGCSRRFSGYDATTVKVVIPFAVGLVVWAAVYFLMAMYSWTAIHSGWSQGQINAFYLSVDVVPPIVGVVAASATYRLRKGRN